MKDALREKWIAGAAGDRTGDVAVRALQNRLSAVQQLLPLAARKAQDDIEYVHELRVWARRAAAALGLYKDLIPHRRFSWMRKQLKRIRRASSHARNCDVLMEWLRQKRSSLGAKRWLEELCAERKEAQKAVVDVCERLEHGRLFARRIDKLLQKVRSSGEEKTGAASSRFGNQAQERLGPVVEQFCRAVPSDMTDEAALHQFRIRGKKLRYTMELLAGAFPDEFRTMLYAIIEVMQARLGEINDLATTKTRLQQKLEAAGSTAEAVSWRRLLASGQRQFDQARQAFQDWCTPQRLQELCHGFEPLTGRPIQTGEERS